MRTQEVYTSLKAVREKLKECKDEWLEKNQKGQPSLGVLTVQQILDNATDGVTEWHFSIEKEWREEVHKYNKQNGTYQFDGYVYHVRGTLSIDGLGSRSQYGSKVAIGGKDNQNSSYKSAASDCLKKCASLFGVGSSIYSKVKIETEEPVYQQQQQPEQITLPNGDIQQGEYVWSNNNWIHVSQYQQQQQQIQQQQIQQHGSLPPSGSLTQVEKDQWYDNTMKEFDPKGYQEMQQQTQVVPPSPFEDSNSDFYEVDRMATGPDEAFPFEQAQTSIGVQQQYEAVPQYTAEPQDYQAVQYGAPAIESSSEPATVAVAEPIVQAEIAPKVEVDPLAHINAKNPWNTPENQAEFALFHQHKERLNIKTDAELLPHVREFFKDGSATIASITPEILKNFNVHLQAIQA